MGNIIKKSHLNEQSERQSQSLPSYEINRPEESLVTVLVNESMGRRQEWQIAFLRRDPGSHALDFIGTVLEAIQEHPSQLKFYTKVSVQPPIEHRGEELFNPQFSIWYGPMGSEEALEAFESCLEVATGLSIEESTEP